VKNNYLCHLKNNSHFQSQVLGSIDLNIRTAVTKSALSLLDCELKLTLNSLSGAFSLAHSFHRVGLNTFVFTCWTCLLLKVVIIAALGNMFFLLFFDCFMKYSSTPKQQFGP
jgi:hypothetical protein